MRGLNTELREILSCLQEEGKERGHHQWPVGSGSSRGGELGVDGYGSAVSLLLLSLENADLDSQANHSRLGGSVG